MGQQIIHLPRHRGRNINAYMTDSPANVLSKTGTEMFQFGHMILYVSFDELRYQVFKKSCSCVKCGLQGEVMILERQMPMDSNPHNLHRDPHFNMYGIKPTQDGGIRLVLMTIDHKKPKSKGGSNHISNLQTMCITCNKRKADKYEPQ